MAIDSETKQHIELAFGPDEFATMMRWSDQQLALGNRVAALRLRWRAYCVAAGRNPQGDPGSDPLFCALEEAAAAVSKAEEW